MNKISQDIFKAIHEGKWLKIEYRNKQDEVTKFWIGIKDLIIANRILIVDGLHLGMYSLGEYRLYIDSILSSQVIEGSYSQINHQLVEDIFSNPHKYNNLFENAANLKILNYLEMCNRMDTTPYYQEFNLIQKLDRESFTGEYFQLTDIQFQEIVKNFQYKIEKKKINDGQLKIKELAMNVMSIHTKKGLYVLAYRKLQLDVKRKVLRSQEDITICSEYIIDGKTESIRKFLDAEDYNLLIDFEKNQEKIKDCIAQNTTQVMGVDDMPYVIGLGMDIALDLHKEYQSIIKMYEEDNVTIPIKAFFGDLLARPRRNKEYPIALINDRINLDQLLAINNGMKYPLAYIQGPPGTGKTNTIINTIITAYFNERTVLFASYNNHPINGVFEKLSEMRYRDKRIPFPVLRLGNIEKMREAIAYIKDMYERVKKIQVFEETLDRRKGDRILRAKQLSKLLKQYEDVLELRDRKEAIKQVIDYQERNNLSIQMIPFQSDLQGRQLRKVDKMIADAGEITDKDALGLLDSDYEQLKQYLFYTSAKYIKRLGDSRYKEFYSIVFEEKQETQVENFTRYLSKTENIKKIQKIFPIIITTCISAHKLGEPESMFDMVIIDEASQCNTAVSLVPIIRGDNLMLVGDPQQLNPVILLDELNNQKLRKKYNVPDEYDYRKNSIYKTFLSCDSVSDEVLLHNHYRCNKKIIDFNNKKYYNSKLSVCSSSSERNPLVYLEVSNQYAETKNTAPAEADAIIEYAITHKDKTIGVITPFVNQKKLIEDKLRMNKISNVACGTVHAFQGDEKDVILFSTALSDDTHNGTYEWLKNNKELINVATSRAKDKLVVLVDSKNLERLNNQESDDDLYELIQYVRNNGVSCVTAKKTNSRALGVKPFSTAVEEAFLQNLTHALENIWLTQSKYTVKKEVAISQVFQDNVNHSDLFYSGRFDFVVYEKIDRRELPVLAIELDGKEHFSDEVVMKRDKKKNEICLAHDLQLIRVENSYARRYNHIKDILVSYFSVRH